MKYQNVLITGASGFLGSHIADRFSEAGHHVTLFDRMRSPYLRDDQTMLVGDILDPEQVHQACQGIDLVIHLAAIADIDAAKDQPLHTMQVNVMGTAHLLEAMRANGIQRLLFASTIYVYSQTGSFYRVSKHSCELMLEEYQARCGIQPTVLRFGTLYGTRSNESNSVYRYLKRALEHETIHCKGTGEEAREYIHVKDAADICLHVIEDEFQGQTLVLTGHHRLKVYDLLLMIKEILGNKNKIELGSQHQSHYQFTPYSYNPRVGKKIVLNTYRDLGQGLIEVLEEISHQNQTQETVHLSP